MNTPRQLRSALRRKPAPEGFAERVVARLEAAPERRANWLPAAAVILLLIGGGGAWRAVEGERTRREGERAKEQLMLALTITAEKTNDAKRALEGNRSGERRGEIR
jgi:hypothetical protein